MAHEEDQMSSNALAQSSKTRKVTWNTAHAVSALFALALTAALGGQAYAGSCEGGDRIDHEDADCLDADWNNSTNWLSHGKVWARNECSSQGTVVAKVDIKDAKDKTWNLTNANKKSSGTGIFNTRNVYCCSDLSDLCNMSDINANSCLEKFQISSANTTCRNVSISVNDNYQCVINAECQKFGLASPGTDYVWHYESESISVNWHEVEDLHNCPSELTVGECG